ncbi:MAG TPA: phage baseplate assembly protein V [Enhygromyxa sp.]|nr:phage baseplate assembly protein V [Enhygromyxa sp.]
MSMHADTLEQLRQAFEHLVRGRFYGKYEGVVTDVDDPLGIARLRARVPAVFGEQLECGWALPCAPFGGGKERGAYMLPEVGDTVWIEFAAGDPSRPIWAGCFWGAPSSSGSDDDLAEESGAELPSEAQPGQLVIKTAAGHLIHIDDEGGQIMITASDGDTRVVVDAAGKVVIEAGEISLGKNASEKLVLGDAFMQLFNQHTHSTGVGPSGPPTPTMTSAQLSSVSKTE